MRCTGEVMGIDRRPGLAFAKSQIAAGAALPTAGSVFLSLADRDKEAGITVARRLAEMGFTLLATRGTAAALAAGGAPFVAPKRAHASGHHEILHWNWLGASDKEVWSKMIDAFNDAHKDKGVQIKMEDVAYDQYKTKILASVATGRAPDFGWGIAGQDAKFAKGVKL